MNCCSPGNSEDFSSPDYRASHPFERHREYLLGALIDPDARQ